MFSAVVLFCAVLALTTGEITKVNECLGSNAGLVPLNTYIGGCTEQPCDLPQGQDAVVTIIFKAPYTIHSMRTVAIAYLGFVPLPYDLRERAETCNYLANTYCPVVRDEVAQYQLNMPIEDFMPVGTQLPIEFRIQDHSNRNFICIRVTVRITPPVASSVGKLGARNATLTVED